MNDPKISLTIERTFLLEAAVLMFKERVAKSFPESSALRSHYDEQTASLLDELETIKSQWSKEAQQD